jgi:hypothetical protein
MATINSGGNVMMSPYQAFPIHDYTYQGVATDVQIKTGNRHGIVHCMADTDITLTTATGSIVITGLTAGMDFVCAGNANLITSTGEILLS